MHRHVAAVWAIAALGLAADAVPAADQRSYAASRAQLELHGETHMLSHASGGTVVGEVAVMHSGSDPYAKKQLSGVRVEDVVVRFQPGQFTQVISDTLKQPGMQHDGVLQWLDASYKTARRQSFEDALVTGITFPAMDGASKEAGYITMTLSPEQVKNTGGDGSAAKSGGGAGKEKTWVSANFRVSVPGIDAKKVKRVEPIEMRVPAAAHAQGDARDNQKVPGRVDVGNVKLVVADAEPWAAWHDDFVVKGNNGDDKERTLTIDLLSPDMKSVQMSLQATGVGIVAVRPRDAGGAGSEKVAETEVELYVETLAVQPKGASASSEPKPAQAAAADAAAQGAKAPAAEGTKSTAPPAEAIRARPAARERVR